MARMPSVMNHQFSQVPRAEIPRSSFDRSHGLKTSFDSGLLIPVYVDEVLPGDTFNMNMTAFCRLATPLHPFMDNVYVSSFFFAVPIRLLWANFPRFMGEQPNPGDSTDFLIPQIVSPTGTGHPVGSLYDYLQLPTGVGDLSHSALWPRAYNLIWNEWFRDQNLQDRAYQVTNDGPDAQQQYVLRRRGKRHDYFTSALPWPQKGDSVDIPLGTQAPIKGLGILPGAAPTAGPVTVTEMGGTSSYPYSYQDNPNSTLAALTRTSGPNSPPEIYADLTQATAATINQLRQAFQIQKLYERDARGGTRYTEIIRAHYNVTSPDARLQRPEYLGGGQSIVNLHTVPQTSASDQEPTPQGNLSAYGTASLVGHGFSKSFTEHCVIIGMVSVRADLNYQQGLDRMWSRRTKFDHYWPALSMIGEQSVLNKEIYAQGGTVGSATQLEDEMVFGYQERFAEYRYKPSHISGVLRSTHTTSLDTWHLAQDFGELPLLNEAFIEDKPPIERVIAVLTEPQFIGDFYFNLRCARPMPVYGVPGLIDHF